MARPEGKVPIAEGAAAGVQFLAGHWTQLLPGSVLMGAGYAYYYWAAAKTQAGSTGDPIFLIALVLVVLISVVAGASFFRLAVRDEYPKPVGLLLGADELRYLGAVLWQLLPFLCIALVAVISASMILGAAAQKAGISVEQISDPNVLAQLITGGSGLAFAAIMLAAVWAAIWLSLRLATSLPATIGERRILVWETTKWTKGNVWRILAAYLLLLVPLFILTALIQAIAGLALGVNPSQAQAGTAPATTPTAIFGFIYGLSSGLLTVGPMVGLQSFLFKGLKPRT